MNLTKILVTIVGIFFILAIGIPTLIMTAKYHNDAVMLEAKAIDLQKTTIPGRQPELVVIIIRDSDDLGNRVIQVTAPGQKDLMLSLYLDINSLSTSPEARNDAYSGLTLYAEKVNKEYSNVLSIASTSNLMYLVTNILAGTIESIPIRDAKEIEQRKLKLAAEAFNNKQNN